MTIPDEHVFEIAVSGQIAGQRVMNVMHYHVDSGAVGADGGDLAQAFWDDVKGWWRAVCIDGYTAAFQLVTARDITDLTGAYGSYAIPLGEQGGTRTTPAAGEGMPPFISMGVRLNVGSRITRPGQKRLGGFTEADQANGSFVSAVVTAGQTWGDTAIQTITLPAPALLAVLTPVVVRKNPDGSAAIWQPFTSAAASNVVTTQNTRKAGRGI